MLAIQAERPDQAEVVALLATLDDELHSLDPPEADRTMDARALLDASVNFLVARLDGVAVAAGAVRRIRVADSGEIKRMFVASAQRGQRIAERMLQELAATLRAEGLAGARLATGRAQSAAIRLYERCGCPRCASLGGYPGYSDNGLSLLMAKAS